MDYKVSNQRKHSAERAMERFRLEYTNEVREAMIFNIEKGDARFVSKRKRRALYLVVLNGEEYPVVYDKSTREICSFLPWSGVNNQLAKSRDRSLWNHQR